MALNPLKWYQDLRNTAARKSEGCFLVEGPRAVGQIVDGCREAILEILTTEELAAKWESYPHRILTEVQLNKISTWKTPQPLIALVRLPDIYSAKLPAEPGDRVLVLEDVQDPGNVGTLIRSAAAFGFSGIISSEKGADPFGPKCVQASAGTLMSLWHRRHPAFLEMVIALKESGYTLTAADMEGREAMSGNSNRQVLILGNEAVGISQGLYDLADTVVKIPIDRKRAESLNVATSGGILMYLYRAGN